MGTRVAGAWRQTPRHVASFSLGEKVDKAGINKHSAALVHSNHHKFSV